VHEPPKVEKSPIRPAAGAAGSDPAGGSLTLKAETEELRGCWRIFFIVAVLAVLAVIGIVGYQYAFEWQPWKSRTERVQEQRADQLSDLPPIPDVVGQVAYEGVYALTEAGYEQILLFSSQEHGVALTDLSYNPGLPITLTDPAPGEPASFTVNVWIGERPETPQGVEDDSFWFPHRETISERGTFQCIQACHDAPFCESCHESRLRGADSPLLADPEAAPELARAVGDATGTDPENLIATFQGDGWYRVDFLVEEPSDVAAEAEAAREAAVRTFPAAFSIEDDAEVVVVRWMDAGSQIPIVEIGLERETYEREQWMSVTPPDIPWVVDRYVVASGLE
jgi:hypothetical protein